jgi:hypothetical protein
MFTAKRCLAILAFICGGTFVHGQMPAGFPVMPNTGDAEADAISYDQAKQAWMLQQPNGLPANPVGGAQPAQLAFPQEVLNAQYEAQKTAAAAASQVDRTAEIQANHLRELQRTYALNKDQWAATDPERLQVVQAQLGIGEVVSMSYIPQSEFQTFSAEKQTWLLNNPSLFTIVQD